MGLDGVELIMAFEEEFDIKINDEEASKLFTPRKTAELVAQKLNVPIVNHDKYLFPKKFNVFRRFLMREFDIERQKIKPNVLMADLLQNNLPKKWMKISNFVSGGKIASLELLPNTYNKINLYYALSSIIFSIIIIVIALYYQPEDDFLKSIYFPIIFIATMKIINIFYSFRTQTKELFATEIPEHLNTVGKITAYISLSKNEYHNSTNDNELNFDIILQRIISITHEQLLIPIDQIKPDSHFIDDLNLDR